MVLISRPLFYTSNNESFILTFHDLTRLSIETNINE